MLALLVPGDTHMLAQALVEHGMLSGLASTIQRTSIIVEDYVRDVDPRLIAGVLLLLVFLFFKRR